jgi:hypothetical protein
MKKRFSLSRVFKLRDKLFQQVHPYVGRKLVGTTFQDLVADVYRVMPNYVSHSAVFESTRILVGSELLKKTAAEYAWRLAGNIDELIAGNPVVPWTRQFKDEWLPILVLRVDYAKHRGKPGCFFQFRVLAGSPCPGVFSHFMSKASCAGISNIVGFSRNMPYTNNLHFTGLKFWVLANAAKSADAIYFHEVDCTASMRASNQKILAIRTRLAPCPRNFEHACENCVVGYDSCPAGIFPKQLAQQLCAKCNRNSYFDTTRSDEICLTCWRTNNAEIAAGN